MQIGSATLARTYRTSPFASSNQSAPSSSSIGPQDRSELGSLLLGLGSLARKIESIVDGLESTRVSRSSRNSEGGSATSESSLGLNLVTTTSSLTSAEEINTTSTSYSTTAPSFEGSSTANPTIGGVYTGEADETLTFQVTRGGIIGIPLPKEIEVRDAGGGLVETISLGASYSAGEEISLSNGLTVAFTSGTLTQGDQFNLNVSASVGTSVNPDASFDGAGDDSPFFDTNLNVDTGSFELNGTTIAVESSDSINSVIGRINSAGIGVSASFNTSTEKIELIATAPGSATQITVENDDSGFVEATKLASGDLVVGVDDERDVLLSQVSQFSSVVDGSFKINDVEIAVDPDADSLNDVLNRINASAANVTAQFDEGSGKITIASNEISDVELAEDTSNILATFDIEADVYASLQRTKGKVQVDHFETERVLGEIQKTIGIGFSNLTTESAKSEARIFSAQLKSQLRRVFNANGIAVSNDDRFDTQIGIVFEFEEEGINVSFDLDEFQSARRYQSERVVNLLKSDYQDNESLFELFRSPIETTQERLGGRLERIGSFLNRLA